MSSRRTDKIRGGNHLGSAALRKKSTRFAVSWVLAALPTISCLYSALPLADGTAAYRRGDLPTARRLLLPAAQSGDAQAQLLLGNIAAQRDASEQDLGEAVLWYRRAAEHGLAAAQAKLAACYAAGNGVPQSDVEAVKWYRRAAERGEVQAAASLGYYYQFGEGVPHDPAEAARWYRVAASRGDHLSQKILGDFYTSGIGVAASASDATLWYRHAAEQGDPDGQEALARAYYEGTGVARNLETSYFWATVAIHHLSQKHNAREATIRLLSALAREMTQSQMEQASDRAVQWHPAAGSTDSYYSPDGTLGALVVVTGAGGESQVEIREGSDTLLTRRFSSPDGQHGFIVQHAEWTPDSRFFVFSLASSGGHQPWHFPTFFYSRRVNKVEALDPYTGSVADPDFRLSAPDTISVMTVMPADPIGSRKEVRARLGDLQGEKR